MYFPADSLGFSLRVMDIDYIRPARRRVFKRPAVYDISSGQHIFSDKTPCLTNSERCRRLEIICLLKSRNTALKKVNELDDLLLSLEFALVQAVGVRAVDANDARHINYRDIGSDSS